MTADPLRTEPKRVYPQGYLASQVLGFVGTDNAGLSGLEYSQDEALRGEDGERRLVKDALGEPVSLIETKRAHAGHDALPRARLVDFNGEFLQIRFAKRSGASFIARNLMSCCGLRENPGVGATGHWNAGQALTNTEHILECRRHRPRTGASGEDERPVDIE